MKPSTRLQIAAALGLCAALGLALWQRKPPSAEVVSIPPAVPGKVETPPVLAAADAPAASPETEAAEPHVHGPHCNHGHAAKPEAGEARFVALAEDFLEKISQAEGASLDLPDGLRIAADGVRVERDAKGVVRIYGSFKSPEPGRLFFQRQDFDGVAGRMVGHVIFDREDALAWKVLPEGEGGAPVLKQVSVHEIICMGLPPQEMPQDHPGSAGVPNPPHQAVIPLQSLPGATGVVYLDFDGEKGPFPGWWDHDAVHSGFNNDTMRDIWIRVAEDFLPFNLNVTTDRKVYDAAPQGQRIHCIISSTYGGGGVAYVGSFNWGGDPICWANSYTGEGAVTVITHEVGHTLGLWHHGIYDSEYYGGHGGGVTSWAPIMGVGYGANLKHWSKGDYQGATKPWQDDLNVITTQNNGVAYRADDVGDTLATAAHLNVAAGGTVANQQGIIGTTGEVDAFRFKTSGGAVSLNLKTTDYAPNLDILAELVDAASGTVLASNNPAGDIIAAISTTVPAGEYLLKVSGTGMGSPADLSGYSNYGSLGSYRIDGTVAGAETYQGFTIAENSAAAASVGTLQPVSLTGTLSYAITGGNAGGAFAIDPAIGTLTVANPAALNYETLSTRFDDPSDIELFVTISNGTASEVVRALVNVTNVNEAPSLSGGTSLTIIENTRSGIQLATLSGSDPDRYDFPVFSFASGNEAGFFAIDAGFGRISIVNPPVVAADTTYDLVVQVVDNNGAAAPNTVTVSVTVRNLPGSFTGSPGGLYRTFFHAIGGTLVSDLTNSPAFPNSPDREIFLTSMDGVGYGDNFGSTMRGYLIPPVSGTYQFWVATDDASQLILGSNATQVSTPVIASISTWTEPYNWDGHASAASVPISLVAGQPYYIELRHKEGGGGDHAAVAWSGPGISRQVIPGLYLAPFDQNYAPRPSGSLTVAELAPAGTVLGKLPVTEVNAEDSLSDYAITGGSGANLFAIDPVTGNVSLAVAGQFNVPNTLFYDLTFSVKDNGSPVQTGSGTVRINVQPANLYFDPNGSTAGSVANAGSYPWIGSNWAVNTGGTLATQAWSGNATARFAATNPGAPLAYSVDLAGYNSNTHGNFTGIVASAGTVTFTGNVDNFYLTTPITVTAEAGAAIVFNQTRGGADIQSFNLNNQPATFHGDVTVNSAGLGNNGVVIAGSGNLKLGNAIANYSPAATTIQSGATLTNAGNAGKSFNVGALTMNGGTLTALNSGDASWGNFLLTNGLTVGGSATSVISSDLRCQSNTTQSLNIGETGQDVDLLISGRLGHINGIAWSYANKTGPGTLKVTGVNDIGSLTVSEGTVVLEGTNAIAGMANGGLTNNASVLLAVPSGSVTCSVSLKGSGTYTKSGAGTLELASAPNRTGATVVGEGTLTIGSAANLGSGNLTVANGAVCQLVHSVSIADAAFVELSTSGVLDLAAGVSETVKRLYFNGVWQPAGTYNATVDSARFPGAGNLIVTEGPPPPPGDGTWANASGGDWGESNNWLNRVVADGTGKIASFSLATPATITLDAPRTVGTLAFSGANHTLTGGTLTLAQSAGAPVISVESGRTATIAAELAGSQGMTKSGDGTLVLRKQPSYTGTTTVAAGTLQVAPPSLRHRWSFNGSLSDSVAGAAATSVGAVSVDANRATLSGGARGASYLDLGANRLPAASNSQVTIQLWARQNAVQNWSRIFDFGNGTGNYLMMSWSMGMDPNADRMEVRPSGATVDNSMAPYSIGTEYVISMVVTPGAGSGGSTLVQWYKMDTAGTVLKSGSTSVAWNLSNLSQTNLWLGHSQWPDNDAAASYNELRIWNTALSRAELSAQAAAGPDALPQEVTNMSLAALDLSSATSRLELAGNSVDIGALTGVAGSVVSNGANTLGIGATGATSTFSGSIQGSGSLVKSGAGTVTLAGTNSYTGGTTVSAGKLIISGTVSATSSVGIASGAELEVSGTLGATSNLTNDGTLVLTGAPQLGAGGTITNNGTILNSAPGYTLPANLVNNGTIYNLPAAPSGLTATAGNGQVSLSWSAVSGATGYVVKQSVFAGGPYTTIATPAGTSHIATGLTNGTTYFFVVSATNPAGESPASTEVSATPQSALPAPWLATDIGSVGLAGSAGFSSGTYSLQGAGAGITGTADACHFVYQTGSGDCSVTVRVQSLTNTGSGAKAGVMIRESLAANARAAGVWVSPSSGILFTRRTTAGGTTAVSSSTGKAAPYWVRVTRTGSTFRAFYSANGSTWTQFGNNRTISMGATTYIGIATTSGSTATLCTGVMTNLTASP